ncbi:MAG: type II toxin-antitoxin system prevent-host-death family antitoxin [Pseudonocardiaceae bacterium]|nr:type II toxin-antitoxin system prevent-host-death family antitoxin [Pseudonocardiaceae bacterium]
MKPPTGSDYNSDQDGSPLAEVKAHLAALVSEVGSQHGQITVTRNGPPANQEFLKIHR